MREWTNDQYNELQCRVEAKLQTMLGGQGEKEMQLAVCKMPVPAIICTIAEYERMKQKTEAYE